MLREKNAGFRNLLTIKKPKNARFCFSKKVYCSLLMYVELKNKAMKTKNVSPRLLQILVKREVRKQMKSDSLGLAKMVFTKPEVAELFNVSERTIDRWRDQGILNACNIGERSKVLFSKEEINNTLKRMNHGK